MIKKQMLPSEKALMLEERKVAAIEKIADAVSKLEPINNSLDILSLWFEEIDKDEWGDRIQYYLAAFMDVAKNKVGEEETE